MVAARAADVAEIVIVIDREAWPVVFVEEAEDFAVDDGFADEIDERDIPRCFIVGLFDGRCRGDRDWRGSCRRLRSCSRLWYDRALGLNVARSAPNLGGDR